MSNFIFFIVAVFLNFHLLAQDETSNQIELRLELMSINEMNDNHYLKSNSVNCTRINWKIRLAEKYFFGLYGLVGTSSLDREDYNKYVSHSFKGQGVKGYRENVELTSYLNHNGVNFELGLPIGYTFSLSEKLELDISAGFYVNSWSSTIESARHKNAMVEYSSGGVTEENYILDNIRANGFGFFSGVDLCLKSTENTRVNFGIGYSMLDRTWYVNHWLGPDFHEDEYNVLLDLLRVRLGVSIFSETDNFF